MNSETKMESNSDSEDYHSSTTTTDSETDFEVAARDLLDFRSRNFTPLLALKCVEKEVFPPVADAQRFLNLFQYQKIVTSPSKEAMEGSHLIQISEVDLTKKVKQKTQDCKTAMAGRRFLIHQMPVYRPRKEQHSTLSLMKDALGPLAVLRRVMNEKKRIKVWTRNSNGIRGCCVGFVEAYDKHWNLALRDVDEQFQRKRQIKYPAECGGFKDKRESRQAELGSQTIILQGFFSRSQERKSKTQFVPDNSYMRRESIMVEGLDVLKICRQGLTKKSVKDKKGSENLSAAGFDNLLDAETIKTMVDGPSKSQLKKKGLTIFRKPYIDNHGFYVVAQSQKYEIVERHVGQLLLMGNDVVFIEVSYDLMNFVVL